MAVDIKPHIIIIFILIILFIVLKPQCVTHIDNAFQQIKLTNGRGQV